MTQTEPLFTSDAYLSTCEAKLVEINDRGGLIFDKTCFYATSGGQPGDIGTIERADGTHIQIAATVNGETKQDIIHIPDEGSDLPDIGETFVLHIDWARRYKLMRMHTACHLLSVICPFPITGASVGEDQARVDFDMSEAVDKTEITAKLMALVTQNHPIFTKWITEAELDENPDLVKSKNVRPPKGTGKIRLVCIGKDAQIDSQPCGGTHVLETQEVGQIHIAKIEKKGRENRRFRLKFGPAPT